MAAIVSGERGERRLQRAAQPAERRRPLLRDLVVERDDAAGSGRGGG